MKDYTASNGIKSFSIEEGNVGLTKCLDDFGGPNMWRLHVKTISGYWEDVQWIGVYKAQQFVKTKLPVYDEKQKQTKYKLAQ
jgi:hypothetical protein